MSFLFVTLSQVHHPVKLEVATRVSRICNSSFDVTANIYDEFGAVVVTSKAVCVWFDFLQNQKQAVPVAARNAVLNFEVIKPA